MSSKSANISARIDPNLKHDAEQVFKELGLTTSQAITLFYRQVHMQRGLPFDVKVPKRATLKAIRAAEAQRGLESFHDVEEFLMMWRTDLRCED